MAGPGAAPARLPVELEVVSPRDVGDEAGTLHEGTDPRQDLCPEPDRLSEQADRPGVGADEAEQHPKSRRLAGTVRTEQPDDGSALHAEGEAVDGSHCSEPLAQVAHLNDRVRAHRFKPR